MKNKINIRFDEYIIPMSVDAVKSFIINELKRLSVETGYPIDSLQIKFYRDKNSKTIAYFSYYPDEPIGFFFNLSKCEGRSANQIIDTCRHEFSHYVVYMKKLQDPKTGHGTAWKDICKVLGANPQPYADDRKTKHFKV